MNISEVILDVNVLDKENIFYIMVVHFRMRPTPFSDLPDLNPTKFTS
jgi:hypothetical protein